MKRFDRSNGLDTALYQNITLPLLYLYLKNHNVDRVHYVKPNYIAWLFIWLYSLVCQRLGANMRCWLCSQ